MRPRHRRATSENDCDPLASYLQEIGAYRMLDQSEELELATRIQAGDEDALNALVCANLRFVVAVAKKYQNQGVPLADLINEGNLGLVRAASRFDGGKGVKFISYAVWWIRRAMLQAISDNGYAVRIPLGRVGAAHRIRRRANGMRQELGRDPSQLEVANDMHIEEVEVESSLSVVATPISLDAPRGNGTTTTLLDLIPDRSEADGDEQGPLASLSFSVEEAMLQLRERERYVLRLYFGFDAPNTLTLDQIAARLGITRERVRQIKDRALSRLRKSAEPRAATTHTVAGVR